MTLGSTRWFDFYPFEYPETWQGPVNLTDPWGTAYSRIWPDDYLDYGDQYEATVQVHVICRLISGPSTPVEVWLSSERTPGEYPSEAHLSDLVATFTVSSPNWTDLITEPRVVTIGQVIPSGRYIDRIIIRIIGSGRVEFTHFYMQEVGPPLPVATVTRRLSASGVVDNLRNATPGTGTTVFGNGIWNDGSDTTYAAFGWSDPVSTSGRGVIDTYSGGELTKVTMHFRASAGADASGRSCIPITAHLIRTGPSYGSLIDFFGGGVSGKALAYYGHKANFDIPSDGVIRDYSCTVDGPMLEYSGWYYDQLDLLRPELEEEGNAIFFDTDEYPDSVDPDATVRVYEAWLIIESKS
jgi:hypothetical protein